MKRKRGFTLLEIIISLAILTVAAMVISSPLSSYRDRTALDADAESIARLLREARANTVASREASAYGVHFSARAADVFRGSAYAPGAEIGKTHRLGASIEWGAFELASGGSDIIFRRLAGTTTDFGTVTVRTTALPSVERTIRVEPSGLIDVP